MARWHFPVDPDCPDVIAFFDSLYGDPMSQYAPLDDIAEGYERKHRGKCKRCKEYGAANIEVEI